MFVRVLVIIAVIFGAAYFFQHDGSLKGVSQDAKEVAAKAEATAKDAVEKVKTEVKGEEKTAEVKKPAAPKQVASASTVKKKPVYRRTVRKTAPSAAKQFQE